MTKIDETAVRAELAALREALEAVEVPAIDENALRARFRAARPKPRTGTIVRRGRRATPYLAAASLVLAVGAAVVVMARRASETAVEPIGAADVPPFSLDAQPFQRLPGAPGFAPTASFSVVRVRIPLTSFAIVPGSEQSGSIEADLLVGEDGLAHGIRFTQGGVDGGTALVR